MRCFSITHQPFVQYSDKTPVPRFPNNGAVYTALIHPPGHAQMSFHVSGTNLLLSLVGRAWRKPRASSGAGAPRRRREPRFVAGDRATRPHGQVPPQADASPARCSFWKALPAAAPRPCTGILGLPTAAPPTLIFPVLACLSATPFL